MHHEIFTFTQRLVVKAIIFYNYLTFSQQVTRSSNRAIDNYVLFET